MADIEFQGNLTNKTKLEQAFNFLRDGSVTFQNQLSSIYAEVDSKGAAFVITDSPPPGYSQDFYRKSMGSE